MLCQRASRIDAAGDHVEVRVQISTVSGQKGDVATPGHEE